MRGAVDDGLGLSAEQKRRAGRVGRRRVVVAPPRLRVTELKRARPAGGGAVPSEAQRPGMAMKFVVPTHVRRAPALRACRRDDLAPGRRARPVFLLPLLLLRILLLLLLLLFVLLHRRRRRRRHFAYVGHWAMLLRRSRHLLLLIFLRRRGLLDSATRSRNRLAPPSSIISRTIIPSSRLSRAAVVLGHGSCLTGLGA